ncbi:MAG TPA: hypothetical protein VKW09_15870 [bacterium]|nr:hypothetical protein [bacterium]
MSHRGTPIAGAGAAIAAAVLLGLPLRLTTAQHPAAVQVLRTPGQPPIYVIALSRGRTLHMYLDPGRAGPNEVHGTFFDAQGNGLDLARAPVVSAIGAGMRMALPALLEGPGHFYSDAEFAHGVWTLDIVATTRAAEVLEAHLVVHF